MHRLKIAIENWIQMNLVFYAVIALLCFVILPFVYFYYEEWEEEDNTFMKVCISFSILGRICLKHDIIV